MHIRLAVVAIILVAAAISLAGAALAQPNCTARDDIVDILASKYQETRRAYGLANRRQLLELFASESGTWTALLSAPGGRSCIVASGEGWTEVTPVVLGDDT